MPFDLNQLLDTVITQGANVASTAISTNNNIPYSPYGANGNTGIAGGQNSTLLDSILQGAGQNVAEGTMKTYKPYLIGGAILLLILIFKK